jgi:hypothetical protein
MISAHDNGAPGLGVRQYLGILFFCDRHDLQKIVAQESEHTSVIKNGFARVHTCVRARAPVCVVGAVTGRLFQGDSLRDFH